jgi:hypothetical protein
MAEKFYRPSKNRNSTVRIVGPEPAWLAEIHNDQRLMAKIREKAEMVKMAEKAQED